MVVISFCDEIWAFVREWLFFRIVIECLHTFNCDVTYCNNLLKTNNFVIYIIFFDLNRSRNCTHFECCMSCLMYYLTKRLSFLFIVYFIMLQQCSKNWAIFFVLNNIWQQLQLFYVTSVLWSDLMYWIHQYILYITYIYYKATQRLFFLIVTKLEDSAIMYCLLVALFCEVLHTFSYEVVYCRNSPKKLAFLSVFIII